MKIITFLSMLLFCSICNAQHKECDSGFSYMPTLETSGLVIEADSCLPDSVCKRLWNEFGRSACEETSFLSIEMFGEGSLWHSEQHDWSDSLGCKVTVEYKVERKSKWVAITRKQYMALQKKRK